MASSNDFEKIWESYQEVVKTKDISIVDYCQRRSTLSLGSSKNGIVYSQFQRWYKKHVSGVNIVPVSDTDFQTESSLMISEESNPSPHLLGHVKAKVNYVNIEFSNGLKVCQKSISYEHLKMLVEKLEALC